MLLKVYPNHKKVIAKNIPTLISKATSMPVHHVIFLTRLCKEVSDNNPEVSSIILTINVSRSCLMAVGI